MAASPQAIDIMFASAAPQLKKRSGNALPNFADWVETGEVGVERDDVVVRLAERRRSASP